MFGLLERIRNGKWEKNIAFNKNAIIAVMNVAMIADNVVNCMYETCFCTNKT